MPRERCGPGLTRRDLLLLTITSGGLATTTLLAACGGAAATAAVTSGAASVVRSAPVLATSATTASVVASAPASDVTAALSSAVANTAPGTASSTALSSAVVPTAPVTVPTAAAGTPAAAPVQLDWTVWATPEAMKAHQATVDAFTQQQPTIKVNIDLIDFSAYFDKVDTMIAGGAPPDVAMGSTTWVAAVVAQGLWKPLETFVAQDMFDLGQYFPASLSAYSVHNQQFALPDSTNLGILVYNNDLLVKAGIKPPDKSLSWDTYAQAAKALTVAKGDTVTQWGTNQVGSDLLNFSSFIWMNGGQIFDDEQNPTKSTFSSPETLGAVRWMAELLTKYAAAPAPGATKSIGDPFIAGKLGLQFYSAAALGDLAAKGSHINWDASYLPVGSHGLATYVGGSGQGIVAASKHAAPAWKLLQWVCGAPGLQQVLAKQWGLPPLKDLAAGGYMTLPPPPANRQAVVDMVNHGRRMAQFTKMMQVYTPVYGKWLTQAMVGTVTPEAACLQIDNAVNALINQK